MVSSGSVLLTLPSAPPPTLLPGARSAAFSFPQGSGSGPSQGSGSAGRWCRPSRGPAGMPSGVGPTDASSPAGFGPMPGPVLSLSFKCYGRPSVCITSPAEDTAPSRAPDSHHLAGVVSGGSHNIAIFLIFGELKCQPSPGGTVGCIAPSGPLPVFPPACSHLVNHRRPPKLGSVNRTVRKRKKADISCLVITALAP